jgi:hypothetical protein
MPSPTLEPKKSAAANAFVVDRPRPCDAIGEALRDAFSGEFGLPEDMMARLRQIDKRTSRSLS